MSIAEIERFVADLKSNEALRAEAGRAQADKSHATPVDRAVAFAASKGYTFTADEAKKHIKAKGTAAGKRFTDAELDGVAGGTQPYMFHTDIPLSFVYDYTFGIDPEADEPGGSIII
jgi:predicted ribosomally synthesized peptide with nif11-like leader